MRISKNGLESQNRRYGTRRIDLLWFGIYVVVVVEMSQITPPVGFNLFVVQSLVGDTILQIARAALPFFFLMIVSVMLITIFPEIVTYLPHTMIGD